MIALRKQYLRHLNRRRTAYFKKNAQYYQQPYSVIYWHIWGKRARKSLSRFLVKFVPAGPILSQTTVMNGRVVVREYGDDDKLFYAKFIDSRCINDMTYWSYNFDEHLTGDWRRFVRINSSPVIGVKWFSYIVIREMRPYRPYVLWIPQLI